MTPEELAALYAQSVPDTTGWGPRDFRDVLAAPGTFLCTGPASFALGRTAADEAELLLIATAPDARRRGQAHACLQAFETEAAARGAVSAFLEVGERNHPARALYDRAGYQQIALRPDYYRHLGRDAEAALVLSKRLRTPDDTSSF